MAAGRAEDALPEVAEAPLEAFRNQPLEDKVKFMYRNLEQSKFGNLILKCPITSMSMLEHGDDAKTEGNFTRAMKWYSRSLAYAPTDAYEIRATVHLKRAEVLILLRKYKLALMELSRGSSVEEHSENKEASVYNDLRSCREDCLSQLEIKMACVVAERAQEYQERRDRWKIFGKPQTSQEYSAGSDSVNTNQIYFEYFRVGYSISLALLLLIPNFLFIYLQ